MDIRRHIMGMLGIASLAIGVSLLVLKGTSDDQWSMFSSICIRVGLMLAAIWLAFPQVIGLAKRFPPWLLATIGFAGLVVAVRPRMIVYLAPVAAAITVLQFVGWLFKPLPIAKPKRQTRRASKND